MKQYLTDRDLLVLVSLAAKICTEDVTLGNCNKIGLVQFNTLKIEASKILHRLDKEAPTIIPIPLKRLT